MGVRLLRGDCRATLPTLEPGTVQSVITSPPYYGLRDYGLPPLVWGGDADCAHVWETAPRGIGHVKGNKVASTASTLTNGDYQFGALSNPLATTHLCTCGAWLGSLGLEPTPDLYIEHLVEVFRHVWRVLRDDGTCWINLGDSYAGSGKGPSNSLNLSNPHSHVAAEAMKLQRIGPQEHTIGHGAVPGLKPKDLMMMPFRVAMALQAEGWWLRSVIPWLKRNAMPESVTDRPATSVEYIFMLSKSSRYFYGADAVRMGQAQSGIEMGPDLVNQRPAFSNDLWTQSVADARVGNAIGVQVRSGVIRAAIHVASAVLQLSEPQDYIGLLALDSQIRQQRANHFATLDVAQVPVIRRAASHAVRFANGDVSAEQFLKEIHGLWITLPDGNILHEAWRIALLDGAIIDVDGNTSVSVNDASQIGQFEFGHHQQDTTPTPRSRKEPTRGERYGAARGSAPGRTPDRDGGFQTGARNRRNSDWFFESWQGLMLDEQDDPLALVVNPQPFTGAHFATFSSEVGRTDDQSQHTPG